MTTMMENDNTKKRLIGMTPEELKTVAAEMGLPKFTASQIAKRLAQAGATSLGDVCHLVDACRASLIYPFCYL